MLSTQELQKQIIQLKKEKDICILAHLYQTRDIIEVADFVGDSFQLSRLAEKAPQKTVVMCGVRFMAETVKILSPEKRVILSHPEAGCPMAEQLSVEEIRSLKKKYPNSAVVAYINTTSELKTECDVCVTSASALPLIKKLPQEEILFLPDCNLGQWVAAKIPEKTFHFIRGGCPVHMAITKEHVKEAKEKHPDALLLVHPECLPEVTKEADYTGSTTGIMDYVEQSDQREFLIGTDTSIVQHLKFLYPEKAFYPLRKQCICSDMRLTTLADLYHCVMGQGGEEITLSPKVMEQARRCIDTMLR